MTKKRKIFIFFMLMEVGFSIGGIIGAQHHIVYDGPGRLGIDGTAISKASYRHHCTSMGETGFEINGKLWVIGLKTKSNTDKVVLFRSNDNGASWDSLYAHGNHSSGNDGFLGAYSATGVYNPSDGYLHIASGTLQDSLSIIAYNPTTEAVVDTHYATAGSGIRSFSTSIAYGNNRMLAITTQASSPGGAAYIYHNGTNWSGSSFSTFNTSSTGPWEASTSYCALIDSFIVVIARNNSVVAPTIWRLDGTGSEVSLSNPFANTTNVNVSGFVDYSHTASAAIDSGKVGIAIMIDSTAFNDKILYTEYKGGGAFKALENPFPGSGTKRSPHVAFVNDTVFVGCVVDSAGDFIKVVKRTGANEFETVYFEDDAWVETSIGMMGHGIFIDRRPYLLRDN